MQSPSTLAVLGLMWRRPARRHICIGLILLFTLSFGMAPWYAAYLIRAHGMGTGELGVWFGIIFGFGQLVGILGGGFVASRWFAGNERGQMHLCAIMVAALMPSFLLFLFLPQKTQALLSLIPLMAVWSFFVAPTYAVLQRLVPDDMRATSLALVMFLANIIGMGIGPQVVGILSDLFIERYPSHSLRYAMAALAFVAPWAGFHFWRAGKTVREDLNAG